MPTVLRFEEIESWRRARILTKCIYQLSRAPRFSRDYGLKDQIQRAAVSIMSNIAEGFEGQTDRLFISYLFRAKASAGEVRSHLYVALDLNYLNEQEFKTALEYVTQTSQLISAFIKYLEGDVRKSSV